ncbi:MAG: Cys-tRNA(Pro) deacylase [Clostridiaceae bacterium]|nr:Cys-tRNA(Pro) deacylase [Clostridiaceae bacterium]
MSKTNVMRMLERQKAEFDILTYTIDENDLSGEHAALELGLDPKMVYKTLVLHGDKTGYIVACIPVCATLDLKALAKCSENKNVEMIHVKDLFDITGYVRGGCSPIGMKKLFPTYIDQSIVSFDKIAFSAGQRGMQIKTAPANLIKTVAAQLCSIIL